MPTTGVAPLRARAVTARQDVRARREAARPPVDRAAAVVGAVEAARLPRQHVASAVDAPCERRCRLVFKPLASGLGGTAHRASDTIQARANVGAGRRRRERAGKRLHWLDSATLVIGTKGITNGAVLGRNGAADPIVVAPTAGAIILRLAIEHYSPGAGGLRAEARWADGDVEEVVAGNRVGDGNGRWWRQLVRRQLAIDGAFTDLLRSNRGEKRQHALPPAHTRARRGRARSTASATRVALHFWGGDPMSARNSSRILSLCVL